MQPMGFPNTNVSERKYETEITIHVLKGVADCCGVH